MENKKHINIIGAGASGLFAAVEFLRSGWIVDLYDHKHQPACKLILAGQSGLNITKDEPLRSFSKKYGVNENIFYKLLSEFSPKDLRAWLKSFDIHTFVGSSKRVFPVESDSSKIINTIMSYLTENRNFRFISDHHFSGFHGDGNVYITNIHTKQTNAVSVPILLTLGGGSYPQTGSDASWIEYFKKSDISISPLKPMNCGFEVSWSDSLQSKNLPVPVKNIALSLNKKMARGDMMMTHYGLEGGPVYSISREIRECIEKNGYANIHIDLFPDLTIKQLKNKTNKEQAKKSLSSFIKKCLNVSAVKIDLIRECINKTEYFNIISTPDLFKSLPIRLTKPRPLHEAISSSGGLEFAELDNSLMLKKKPGVWCAGEMLNWDAPTGGYLLQGCFSTAYRACRGIMSSERTN